MKIKYNLTALVLLGITAACNPVEDIYNEIDDKGIVITKSEDEYILTAEDYKSISTAAKADAKTKADSLLADDVNKKLALNSFATAEKYVPNILASLYPSWGKGSSVGVTYNLCEEETGLITELKDIKIYKLSSGDYETIWAESGNGGTCLSQEKQPENVIPEVLKTAFADAAENDMVLADYMYGTSATDSEAKPYSMLFKFDGTQWKQYENDEVVLVMPADYDAMGSPGNYDNFSYSDSFEKYLPVFLANKFPYAEQGDTKIVLFKYYADKTTTVQPARYNLDTEWTYFQNIVVREKETFLHNGKMWLFDPSVYVMIDNAGYRYLVEWVAANKPAYMDPAYDNTEYWFGASYHYNNFNIQIIKRRSYDPEGLVPADDNDARKYLEGMVLEGLKLWASHEYPDVPSQMNGVDLYYYISCKVYDGAGNYKYTYKAKSLGSGNFEFEGEPEIVNW